MRTQNWAILLATLALANIPVTASAQGPPRSDGEMTTYEFEEDDVNGSMDGPTKERVRGTLPEELKSLIEVRSDFVDRVRSTVSEI